MRSIINWSALATVLLMGAATPSQRPHSLAEFNALKTSGHFEGGASECQDLQTIGTQSPIYPAKALSDKLEGWVELSVLVNPDGTVAANWPTASDPKGVFEHYAMAAVSLWQFEPCVLEGTPIGAKARVTVNFSLTKAEKEE